MMTENHVCSFANKLLLPFYKNDYSNDRITLSLLESLIRHIGRLHETKSKKKIDKIMLDKRSHECLDYNIRKNIINPEFDMDDGRCGLFFKQIENR